MAAPVPRIHVQPVTPALADAVRALRLAPGQHEEVGDPAFNLAQAQADPACMAMAVLADATVVGFYRLDASPTAIAGPGFGGPALGLRAFLIDATVQGRGYGTRALQAACADACVRHPRQRLLVLAVACRNRAAIAAYRKAGFVDTGERLPGGRAGVQQLMLRALDGAGMGH